MIKNKWTAAAALILASSLTTGCSLNSEAQAQQTIVMNDDVQLDSLLADSTLQLTRKEDFVIDDAISYRDVMGIYQNQLYYNEDSTIYTLDLQTKETTKLADKEKIDLEEHLPAKKMFTFSSDGIKILLQEDGNVYVQNIINGEKKLVDKGVVKDFFFLDNQGYDVGIMDSDANLRVIDTAANDTSSYDLSHLEITSISNVKKVGNNVYLHVQTQKDGMMIYKIPSKGKPEALLAFSGEKDTLATFDVLRNGDIIFAGSYDGKGAIYYFDVNKNEVKQLISGGTDSEGDWIPFYQLSPDEQKILFDMPVHVQEEYKSNVYMAELKDKQLTNSTIIMEKADLPAVISFTGFWRSDSHIAYVMTDNDSKQKLSSFAIYSE
ncbi:TolB-like translocation protein [Bacillus chungangensis]|uniref:Lipoprotein n=1 Tax=Bacillus chungangensis TaxID=587633 RepID=A0ABT9WTR9_9BACI|nr:hypothetical protein [Bacillus chungangensis]MDQ0176677.1 hypothetical protein [Bacillus chungangensis]